MIIAAQIIIVFNTEFSERVTLEETQGIVYIWTGVSPYKMMVNQRAVPCLAKYF